MLFVNAWELAVAFADLARRMPSAALMDCVPATVGAQLRQQGLTGLKRAVGHQIHHRSFARVAREFEVFLPKSSDCAASLHRDYGVETGRCLVTLAPLHLDSWKPGAWTYSAPARLLFVGNDFARKGGEFLLRLYTEHMSSTCTLTIASNDPALAARPLPSGVELLRGQSREDLLKVFQRSDIFVFPTQQDYTPEVVAEALAVGLPCIVGDVDGARDLIRDGETGFVMPRGAGTEHWAKHLRDLISNPEERNRMSKCARAFAEEKLAFEDYERLVTEAVERLRARATELRERRESSFK
jgi:glycosyltransferase involved in cell wall biosynthesis